MGLELAIPLGVIFIFALLRVIYILKTDLVGIETSYDEEPYPQYLRNYIKNKQKNSVETEEESCSSEICPRYAEKYIKNGDTVYKVFSCGYIENDDDEDMEEQICRQMINGYCNTDDDNDPLLPTETPKDSYLYQVVKERYNTPDEEEEDDDF